MEEQIKSLTTLNYSITPEEYEKSYIDFQKRNVFPKYIVMTVVLGIIIMFNINSVFHDPTYKFGWGAIGICLACIAAIWMNTVRLRKTMMNCIEDIDGDKYITNIYEDSIVIQTEIESDENGEDIQIPPRTISYITDRPKIAEIKEMFIIYLKDGLYYVIPKRNLDEEQINILVKTFEEKFDDRFIKYNKA